ncbi:DMT family transporter [Fervidobacterium thailandense]|uniref:EamA domain-containing protein n=1 Tax=Fervidobacterium thailandense TaxID=1008305 RepID=A0A1E3G5P9_9BACT|nr:DMT family transporter [Fervidobacterium thailandense]ODN31480.1 hypothetical protein A4H02_01265 [Fervidobacterium thailandense]
MGAFWMVIRILLLGYERIAGSKISKGSPTFVAAWGFFFFSFIAFAPFFNSLTFNSILRALLSGTIYSISFTLYTYALGHEDTSVVAPLYNLNAIFLVFLSSIFLGEKLSVWKILGAVMMVYGISFLKKGENLRISYVNLLKSKGALSMILASLLMAFGRIVDRRLTINSDPLNYSVAIYLVISAYIFLYGVLYGNSPGEYLDLVRTKWPHLIAGGICNAYSYYALLRAFNYLGVSVAEPLSMLSVFVTMFFAKLLIREHIGLRIVAAVFLISGAFLVYVS